MQLNNHNLPFNARILEFGFINAESAVMGLLKGWLGRLISIITTLFWGAVSRTHMNLSDSIVTCVKVMNCWLIPTLGSCNHQIARKKHHSPSYFGLKTHQNLTIKQNSKRHDNIFNLIRNWEWEKVDFTPQIWTKIPKY